MTELPQAPGGGKLDGDIPFRPLRVAVLTVSDTRNEESDTSGSLLADRVVRDGHVLAARKLDRHVVLEDVAFEKNSFTNRNKVRAAFDRQFG